MIADRAAACGRPRPEGGATLTDTVTREDADGVATLTLLRPGLT
ncbi:enoyl-CoA hydratase, partial [Blastococcus sp. MG754426]|nr:enoyl-CoA hydratase [Blastococcus sp. MG754426]MCF6514557.1 enoyl-CoA hydratase [Blastococcus sp. MG754427]